MRSIFIIAHNLRSCHNVGSLLRTAEGLGITSVYLTGYTPHPSVLNDSRLPHIVAKIEKQIHKTALGAENTQAWQYNPDIITVLDDLKTRNIRCYALEQSSSALPLPNFELTDDIALIIGREVEGVEQEILATCEGTLEIPMFGEKESFNVVQAAAMAMYHIRFMKA